MFWITPSRAKRFGEGRVFAAASLAGIKTAKERQSKKRDFVAGVAMIRGGTARNGGDLAGCGLRSKGQLLVGSEAKVSCVRRDAVILGVYVVPKTWTRTGHTLTTPRVWAVPAKGDDN